MQVIYQTSRRVSTLPRKFLMDKPDILRRISLSPTVGTAEPLKESQELLGSGTSGQSTDDDDKIYSGPCLVPGPEDELPGPNDWDTFLSDQLGSEDTNLPMVVHVSIWQYKQPMRVMVSQQYGDKADFIPREYPATCLTASHGMYQSIWQSWHGSSLWNVSLCLQRWLLLQSVPNGFHQSWAIVLANVDPALTLSLLCCLDGMCFI